MVEAIKAKTAKETRRMMDEQARAGLPVGQGLPPDLVRAAGGEPPATSGPANAGKDEEAPDTERRPFSPDQEAVLELQHAAQSPEELAIANEFAREYGLAEMPDDQLAHNRRNR